MMEAGIDTGRLLDAVRRLQLLIRVAGDDALSAQNLTFAHASVLVTLAASGPSSCSSLARQIGITRQSMQQLVGTLHERSLLEKRSDPLDARHIIVNASPAGRTAANEASAVLRNIESQMVTGLSALAKRQMLDGLRSCIDNLDRPMAAS